MKLSKSKLALAKLINENGGWPELALWAAQDNCIAFFIGGKPEYKSGDRCWYSNSIDGACVWTITRDEKVTNWHQTILSREEYYQAYPKADADGWIEWKGGECPVEPSTKIGVRYRNGGEFHSIITAASQRWSNNGWPADIIAYRLHKPEVKPEFCESVMRSIPEPESIDGLCAKVTEENKHQHVDAKPTIEQLAQDYRNKLDFANHKQQEADDAKAAADAALGKLERAGEEIGLLLSPIREGKKPEINIIDWRDLMVGDEIICSEDGNWKCDLVGNVCVVREIEPQEYTGCMPILAEYCDASDWGDKFTFVRRP